MYEKLIVMYYLKKLINFVNHELVFFKKKRPYLTPDYNFVTPCTILLS